MNILDLEEGQIIHLNVSKEWFNFINWFKQKKVTYNVGKRETF